MKKIGIAPSILSADFADLKKEIKMLETAKVERIHLDVMDGHFVPNITFGAPVVDCINKATDIFLEAHLMISEPAKYIKQFKDAGSDLIIFHKEVSDNPRELLGKIKDMGIQAGISINPKTPWQDIKDILDFVDMVLIMTVEPGFGGQKYIQSASEKMKEMFEYICEKNFNVDIGIDGGISLDTIENAVRNGANIIIAGSSIFNAKDPIKMIADLREKAKNV